MAGLAGGLGELRWYALVALFVAALATLAVYLVQYALLALRGGRRRRTPKQQQEQHHHHQQQEQEQSQQQQQSPWRPRDELLEEGGSVLGWALSLGSWRRQWRRAWVAALRDEAAARAVSAGELRGGLGRHGAKPRPSALKHRPAGCLRCRGTRAAEGSPRWGGGGLCGRAQRAARLGEAASKCPSSGDCDLAALVEDAGDERAAAAAWHKPEREPARSTPGAGRAASCRPAATRGLPCTMGEAGAGGRAGQHVCVGDKESSATCGRKIRRPLGLHGSGRLG